MSMFKKKTKQYQEEERKQPTKEEIISCPRSVRYEDLEPYKNDRQFWIDLFSTGCFAQYWRSVPKEFRCDFDFMVEAIKLNSYIFGSLSKEELCILLSDQDTFIALVVSGYIELDDYCAERLILNVECLKKLVAEGVVLPEKMQKAYIFALKTKENNQVSNQQKLIEELIEEIANLKVEIRKLKPQNEVENEDIDQEMN